MGLATLAALGHIGAAPRFRFPRMSSLTAPADGRFARGVLIMVITGIVLSTGGPIIRQIEDASGLQITFWRSLAQGGFIFLLLAARDRGQVFASFRDVGWAGVFAGGALALAIFGYVFSITNTTVANTLFLLSTAPFFAAILGYFVLHERVGAATAAAIAVALVGVAIMVGDGLGAGRWLGNLAGIACALLSALFVIGIRLGKGVDMVPTVCLAGVFAAVLAFLAAGGAVAATPHDVAWAAAAGAFQVGLGFVLYTIGSRYLPAAELTVLGLLEVILGPIWTWLLVGEVPSTYTVGGGIIVLAAIAGLAGWS
ncbi:MAG: DMT family transporter, partial [Alphaproteobacteria bacterium]|nr:DMT family transporter [Alphaproteobacteria bacterium]